MCVARKYPRSSGGGGAGGAGGGRQQERYTSRGEGGGVGGAVGSQLKNAQSDNYGTRGTTLRRSNERILSAAAACLPLRVCVCVCACVQACEYLWEEEEEAPSCSFFTHIPGFLILPQQHARLDLGTASFKDPHPRL